MSRYETTRQPGVITAASSIFSAVTGSNYTAIIKPMDSEELLIRDDAGVSKNLTAMSRGTKEQLYLAMRLGLIEEYESRSEPLPVIMDDILVNFDDERGPLAVKALKSFAADRQVIVLTCHKDTLNLYKDLGVHQISVD